MSSNGSGYDYSPTTFSPVGRIYQVEYANAAVKNSGTALGIKCKDGVVLALEKLLTSKMLVPGSNRRIFTIDRHLGVAVTGIAADGRKLAAEAKAHARTYKQNFGSPIPPKVLANQIGSLLHAYTCYGALRPFGSSILIAGVDPITKQHELYMSDPSGQTLRYFGCAIGKGVTASKTEIEKGKMTERTCAECLQDLARILHLTHDENKDKPFELEMGWICEASGWQFAKVPQDLRDAANAAAKAELDESSDDDSDDDSDDSDDDDE